MRLFLYIFVMAAVTYLVRAIPFTLFRKKIKSRFFRSFFHYIPYTVLSAMTIPAIFYSTGDIRTAAVGAAAAAVLSLFELPLVAVAVLSAGAAFVSGLLF